MSELLIKLSNINTAGSVSKEHIVRDIKHHMNHHGYKVIELDDKRPWGAFLRLDDVAVDDFIKEFFPGLKPESVRLGNSDAKLSPKILIVSPKQRLSWQYHDRRAELWSFLTGGHHHRSKSDDQEGLITVNAGDVVQFDPSERHRLVGRDDDYTLVAEIWQHTDPNNLSDEDDIIRLHDDYSR